MKPSLIASAAVLALATTSMLAQSADMKGMDMKGGEMKSGAPSAAGVHKGAGVVKKLDAKSGTATIAHGPIKSMNWPAMSMTFQVPDKSMLDKLGEGKPVEFEFEQRGKDYVLTSAR